MSMSDIDLTQQELATTRSAAELFQWVQGKIDTIGLTPEGRLAIRHRRGLCKPLAEELFPLALLCETFFEKSPAVELTPVIGNQNYDALVQDNRVSPVGFSRIEVTQGHEGEDTHLRMIHLEREGHANLLGSVRKSGTKRTGLTVSIDTAFRRHEDVVNDQIGLVLSAIEKKLAKRYEPETALLVVFDDQIAIQNDGDREKFSALLETNRRALLNKFVWVGVIGWGRRCFTFID